MASSAVKRATQPRSELAKLRARIDQVTVKLLELCSERARLAVEIGWLKHSQGAEPYQPAREHEVIEHLLSSNQGPLSEEQVARIFTEIVSACRALEHPLKVAYLGPEHTYSHQAALSRFGASAEFVSEPSIAAVFQALDRGQADLGVVPVENSTEGSVALTLDLLIDTQLVIIGEILLPIRHALASRDGARELIRKIVSHQQSLAQCRNFLASNFPACELEAVASNAVAAERATGDSTLAAIASAQAARAYHLRVIAENIQDLAQNTTRFLVMGRRPVQRTGRDKTTVLFAVADRVGALNQVLTLFARNSINISKIESRPLRSRPWEYLFFVDLVGHRDDPGLKRALKGLRNRTLFSKVLGSYPEGRAAGS